MIAQNWAEDQQRKGKKYDSQEERESPRGINSEEVVQQGLSGT